MKIVKAGIESIQSIHQLAHAIWPVAYGHILSKDQLEYMLELIYSVSSLQNQIENLEHQFILIYNDNIAVGFASYSPKEKKHKDVYRLHKLYVLPSQQGKGTGKFLLRYIITQIKSAGALQLELNVNRKNSALNFYNKMGFTIVREEDIDILNGYFMNDYVMNLNLSHNHLF